MILAARYIRESKAIKMMGSGAYRKLKGKSIIREIESFVPSRRMRRLKKNMRRQEKRGKTGSRKQIEKERF
jgi:hypothetical protein